uniref:protein-serine/threonine phosphatase n=1 Tax=Zea mays TaxID=4577 RepID=A0A804LEF7_MAIZE
MRTRGVSTSTTTRVNRGASGQRGGRGGLAAIRTGRGWWAVPFFLRRGFACAARAPTPSPDTHVVQSRAGIFSSDRNRKLRRSRRLDVVQSGCTALSIVKHGDLMVVANVDNSRVVLGIATYDDAITPSSSSST